MTVYYNYVLIVGANMRTDICYVRYIVIYLKHYYLQEISNTIIYNFILMTLSKNCDVQTPHVPNAELQDTQYGAQRTNGSRMIPLSILIPQVFVKLKKTYKNTYLVVDNQRMNGVYMKGFMLVELIVLCLSLSETHLEFKLSKPTYVSSSSC